MRSRWRIIDPDAERALRRIMWECGANAILLYVSAKTLRRGRKPALGNTIPPSVKSDLLDRMIETYGVAAVTSTVKSFQRVGRPRKLRALNIFVDNVDELASMHEKRGSQQPHEDALAEARVLFLDEGAAPDMATIRQYYSRSATELAQRDAAVLADVRDLGVIDDLNTIMKVARLWAATPYVIRKRVDRALRREKRNFSK